MKSSLSSYPVLGDDGVLRIIDGDQSVIDYIQLDPGQFHAAAVMQLEFWERLAVQGDIQEVPKVILDLAELEVDGREVMDEKALWHPPAKVMSLEEKARLRWNRQQKARKNLKARACNLYDSCEPQINDCEPGCDLCAELSSGIGVGVCLMIDNIQGKKGYIGGVVKPVPR